MLRPPLRLGACSTIPVLALLLFRAVPLPGQQVPELRQGTRVRIHMHTDLGSMAHVGTLQGASADSIYFRPETSRSTLVIERTSFDSVQVRTNQRSASAAAFRGAAIGWGIVAVPLAVLGLAIGDCGEVDCATAVVLGMVTLGLPAAALGALIGTANRGDRWITVPLPGRVMMDRDAPARFRIGVGLPI